MVEERKIPVLRKGVLETRGILGLAAGYDGGFSAFTGNETIECFAQNNTLDILAQRDREP